MTISHDNSMLSSLKDADETACPTPRALISSVAKTSHSLSQLGSFSSTVYDSAWLSMVYKPTGNQMNSHTLLFPQCFAFVLREQDENGGWPNHGSHFDGVLHSLAGLLAFMKYDQNFGSHFMEIDIRPHVHKAKARLHDLLSVWDINKTVQVGFEVLVIGLLDQLKLLGITIDFPALPQLKQLYQEKLRRFAPELIYSKKQTTILHSLEALVGIIDFDRVKHHCHRNTGILASPAATAAYLIHSTEWDNIAEEYLRMVLDVADAGHSGGVPSAFPTPVFELSWILSSILSCGIEVTAFDQTALASIGTFLSHALSNQDGTIGFARGLLPDADDTARTLMTLELLGHKPSYVGLLRGFEATDHFRTYDYERNPSFSANCNVLLALLYRANVDEYAVQIEKTLEFVLRKYERKDVEDKWNISPHYCNMLLMQAFVKILELSEAGNVSMIDEEITTERIPIAICRILLRTLSTQSVDGSWNTSLEETSYSILTINHSLQLAWNESARDSLEASLKRGKDFIRNQYPIQHDRVYLWVEKTMYESSLLKKAYCSMALHANNRPENKYGNKAFCIPYTQVEKMTSILSSLPNFSHNDLASIGIILAEASHLSKYLRRIRQEILDRDQIPMTKDRYLEFIPVIWTMCNAKAKHVLSATVVRDMVRLSLLNYQIDEYMETTIAELDAAQICYIKVTLQHDLEHNNSGNSPDFLHGPTHIHSSNSSDSGVDLGDEGQERASKKRKLDVDYMESRTTAYSHDIESDPVSQVVHVLRRFIAHVSEHDAVLSTPPQIQDTLLKELHTFIFAHMAHNADNIRFRQSRQDIGKQGFSCSDSARGSFCKWVNSTGADDTSAPFSFQFFTCLIHQTMSRTTNNTSAPNTSAFCLPNTTSRYIAESLSRRLAAMCRLYNDYGSAARDEKEGNLNSLHFAEFNDDCNVTAGDGVAAKREEQKKVALMQIADFERSSMEHAMSKLERSGVEPIVLNMLNVLVDVTDTFGLMYVQKDIASTRL